MEAKQTVSAAQFFGMMLVARSTLTLSLSARWAAGEGLPQALLSYLLAMALGFALALPVWELHRRYPTLPVGEAARRLLGRAGAGVALLYLLYLVVMGGVSLALFQLFLQQAFHPDFPAWLVLAAMAGVAAFGACRGLEAVARCAGCVLVLLALGTALVFGAAALRFQPENLTPLFPARPLALLKGAALFLGRTSLFADMAVLLPFVKGRKGLGFAAWAGGSSLLVGCLLALMAGCLGPYAYTQQFPVYALASLTGVRSLQRLDPVFVGLWMTGLIVKAACDLFACRVCLSSLGAARGPWGVLGAGAAMLALGMGAAAWQPLQALLMDPRLWLALTALAGVGAPLGLLAAARLRGGRGRG